MNQRITTASSDERRFDRGAWLLLLFGLVFLALDLAQLAYRFSLPTEGWLVRDSDLGTGSHDYPLSQNLVGAQSALQPGDALHIIGGIPADELINADTPIIRHPVGWQVGGRVTVVAIRDGQALTFDIPIVNWTFAAWWKSNFDDTISAVNWIAALILMSVGLFTFFNRPHILAARFLFLFGVAHFAENLSSSLPDAIGSNFDLSATLGKALFSFVIYAYLFGPALLGFALTFPHPKAFVQRRPSWLLAPFLIGSISPLLLLINPGLAAIGFPITLGMVIGAIVSLIHSARTMRDRISRAQLRWAVGGVVGGLALFLLNYPIGLPSPIYEALLSLASMGLPVMGVSLAIAIFRYRLFDIDIIIRRTLIYAVLTGLLALVYFGSVILLQQIFRFLTGQSSEIAIIISTLGIAALFVPSRRGVQEGIDRRFYRRKYDAAKVLAAFGATARDEVELDKLKGELVSVVSETMQPASVSLWLKESHTLTQSRQDGKK